MPTEEQYQSLLYWLGFDKLIILLLIAIVLLTVVMLIVLPSCYQKKKEKPQLYSKRYEKDD